MNKQKKSSVGKAVAGVVGGLVVAGLTVGGLYLMEKVFNNDKTEKDSVEPKAIEESKDD